MESLEKKLSTLTLNRKEQLEQQNLLDQEIQLKIAEKISKNDVLFQNLIAELKKTCSLIKARICANGDDLAVLTNVDASSIADKSRHFINIYVYPKGYGVQKWALNAPGLYIEANLVEGILNVQKRTSFSSPEIVVVNEFMNLNTVNAETLTAILLTTIQEIFHSVTPVETLV